jgi:uncharacterized protein (DUF342 family)
MVMNKIYQLGVNDFKMEGQKDGSIFVTLDDARKRYDSKVLIDLEENGVKAYMTVYPAIGGGHKLTYEDILEVINEGNITVNLDNDAIEKAAQLLEEDTIVSHLHFATGQEARPGRNAVITLQFSTEKKEKKTNIGKDGKVDYKNVDNIVRVKKGDVLITKRPATEGVRGLTVKNTEIIPPVGKDIEIFLGEGVMLNSVGTQYIATNDGYVEFNNNVLAVHQVLFVHGNVDYSSGNIKFNGTVHVKGDILPGFRVEASKDIIVDGVCSDCEVIAHKNLYLKLGIKSSKKNLFRAGEDAVIGYCENATVFAKRNIIIKRYSYGSELTAGNRIEATQADGIIAGGYIKAFAEVAAKQLGTEGNSKFTVEVGTKYYVDQAIARLRKEKARLIETLDQVNAALKKVDLQLPAVAENKAVKKLLEIRENLQTIIKDMHNKEDELMDGSKAKQPKIKVKGRTYEGVTIMIFNCGSTVRQFMENSVFYLNEKYAEVAWVSMKDVKEIETE